MSVRRIVLAAPGVSATLVTHAADVAPLKLAHWLVAVLQGQGLEDSAAFALGARFFSRNVPLAR